MVILENVPGITYSHSGSIFRRALRCFANDECKYIPAHRVLCEADYGAPQRLSLLTSLFSLQSIREDKKLPLLRHGFNGLIPGGALIIAEKLLAENAFFQNALTFDHFDFKRRHFSPEQILAKEQSLRGVMTLWSEGNCSARSVLPVFF